MNNSPWTPELDAKLVAACARGGSFAEIAAELGMSKNQCVGRAHRLGVPPRREGTPRKPEPLGKPSRGCSWPKGDPGAPGFRFCGKPALPLRPYCAEHYARAYQHGTSIRAQ